MLEVLKQKINQGVVSITEEIKLPDDQRNARLEICRSCENLGDRDFCKKCNCYMPLKTYLPRASCPINKWLKINVNDRSNISNS